MYVSYDGFMNTMACGIFNEQLQKILTGIPEGWGYEQLDFL